MNLRALTRKKRYHPAVGVCGYCVRLRDLDNKAPNWDVEIQEKAQIIKKRERERKKAQIMLLLKGENK